VKVDFVAAAAIASDCSTQIPIADPAAMLLPGTVTATPSSENVKPVEVKRFATDVVASTAASVEIVMLPPDPPSASRWSS
jgi:hypothetical protein